MLRIEVSFAARLTFSLICSKKKKKKKKRKENKRKEKKRKEKKKKRHLGSKAVKYQIGPIVLVSQILRIFFYIEK